MHIATRIVLLIIGLTAFAQRPVAAQNMPPHRLQIYVQNDTLRIDVRIDSLFSQRSLDAIESGMTASIAIQFRLLDPRGRERAEISHMARLEHDIWEGEYRLIRMRGRRDTLVFTQFSNVVQMCSNLQNLPLATLPLPGSELTLQGRIQVDPITPEQEERTRKWLKILRKGSLLEFFFSFEDAADQPRWRNLLKFHPNALPHLMPEAPP